jgi:hypothetical protein
VHELVGTKGGALIAEGSGLDAAFAEALGRAGYRVRSEGDEGLAFEPADEDLGAFWRLAAERGAEVRYLGRDALTLEEAVVSVMEGHGRRTASPRALEGGGAS